jgi:hypothetical protein
VLNHLVEANLRVVGAVRGEKPPDPSADQLGSHPRDAFAASWPPHAPCSPGLACSNGSTRRRSVSNPVWSWCTCGSTNWWCTPGTWPWPPGSRPTSRRSWRTTRWPCGEHGWRRRPGRRTDLRRGTTGARGGERGRPARRVPRPDRAHAQLDRAWSGNGRATQASLPMEVSVRRAVCGSPVRTSLQEANGMGLRRLAEVVSPAARPGRTAIDCPAPKAR